MLNPNAEELLLDDCFILMLIYLDLDLRCMMVYQTFLFELKKIVSNFLQENYHFKQTTCPDSYIKYGSKNPFISFVVHFYISQLNLYSFVLLVL